MLGETPKILFLHWSVTGDANESDKSSQRDDNANIHVSKPIRK